MEREGAEVIRILLVDDVDKIRESLRAILASCPHFDIVGEACDGEEAVRAVAQRADPPVAKVNSRRCLDRDRRPWVRRHLQVSGDKSG